MPVVSAVGICVVNQKGDAVAVRLRTAMEDVVRVHGVDAPGLSEMMHEAHNAEMRKIITEEYEADARLMSVRHNLARADLVILQEAEVQVARDAMTIELDKYK